MNVPTMLVAVVHDDDHGACGMCPDLFATTPLQCLRFGFDKCVELVRDDNGRIIRCAECLAAEKAMERALGEYALAVMTETPL